MIRFNPKCWRAPKWAPLWLRRAFPGCWTQEEIVNIKKRSAKRYEEMSRYIE